MRRLHIVGLALTAVFALGAFYASSAFALESVWLVDGAKPAVQHMVDSETTGGLLSLTDAKGGIFGEEVQVLCEGTDLGFVGPGKEDLLETITVGKCETDKGICGEPTAEPINLPWLTTIELIGTKYYDDIITEKSGATTVGYKVICNKAVEDTCEITLGRAELLNNAPSKDVDADFVSTDPNQPSANCTRGGVSAGKVDGTVLILSEEGLTLTVGEG